jgi:hypothetical protein
VVKDAKEVEWLEERAHDEAYIRLPPSELSPSTIVSVCEALLGWVGEHQRMVAGPIGSYWSSSPGADPGTMVCDPTVPLR